MNKYLYACGGDKQQALRLYRNNARLSQQFYGVLSLFEITLRNAINDHYLVQYGKDWIIAHAVPAGLLEHEALEVHSTENAY